MHRLLVIGAIGLIPMWVCGAGCSQNVDNTTPTPAVSPDTIAPTVVSRSPAPLSVDVWTHEPIVVEFSEAVDSSTLVPPGLAITESVGGADVAFTTTVSPDGATVTVVPDAIVGVPNTLTITLGPEITDAAGNGLVPPGDSWSFDYPLWQMFGGPLSVFSGAGTDAGGLEVAVDASGNPVVAFSEDDGVGNIDVHVRHWDGAAWLVLGSGITSTGSMAITPLVAMGPNDELVVAFSEQDQAMVHPYAYEWDGSTWNALGGAITNGGGQLSFGMSLEISTNGAPVIAFNEQGATASDVYVMQWTGTQWASLGGPQSAVGGSTNALSPSLALDTSGNPFVTWQEGNGAGLSEAQVRHWDGLAWNPVGGGVIAGVGTLFGPQISLDGSDNPVIAFQENDVGASETSTYVTRLNGNIWEPVGGQLNAIAGAGIHTFNPQIGVDTDGNFPVVAWEEDNAGDTNVYLRAFNGTTFMAVETGVLDVGAGSSRLASIHVYEWGAPIIAWREGDGTEELVHVWRYNQ